MEKLIAVRLPRVVLKSLLPDEAGALVMVNAPVPPATLEPGVMAVRITL